MGAWRQEWMADWLLVVMWFRLWLDRLQDYCDDNDRTTGNFLFPILQCTGTVLYYNVIIFCFRKQMQCTAIVALVVSCVNWVCKIFIQSAGYKYVSTNIVTATSDIIGMVPSYMGTTCKQTLVLILSVDWAFSTLAQHARLCLIKFEACERVLL
jgi:hypothetical protein